MKFEFSIRKAIKETWNLFKLSPWFFVGLTAIMIVINFAGGEKMPFWMILLSLIAGVIMSYVWLSVALAAVDKKTELLSFKKFRYHLPTLRNFFKYVGVWIVSGACIAALLLPFVIVGSYIMMLVTSGVFVIIGILPFLIPGLYIMIRLVFAQTSYVDRKGTIMQSLRHSWTMVKGDVFWTVLLTMIASIVLIIVGILLLGVGFLAAYPMSIFLTTLLYRKLSHYHGEQAIVVQAVEITAGGESKESVAE